MGEVPGGDQCFFAKRTRTSTADGNHGSGYRTRNRDLGAVLPDAGKMAYAHLHAQHAMSVLDPEASLRVSDIEWEKGWSVLMAKRQLVLYGPARTSLFHLFWLDSGSGARTV